MSECISPSKRKPLAHPVIIFFNNKTSLMIFSRVTIRTVPIRPCRDATRRNCTHPRRGNFIHPTSRNTLFHDRTIQVTQCGRICMEARKINLSRAFAGQHVGIRETREASEAWLREYNEERPHRSLRGLTPVQFYTRSGKSKTGKRPDGQANP